jgi:DNA-binding beta-propeller fold protein YncE
MNRNTVSTIAGNRVNGNIDGEGGIAQFSNPRGLAMDADGNIIVADELMNHCIRKITLEGHVSTLQAPARGGMRTKKGPLLG